MQSGAGSHGLRFTAIDSRRPTSFARLTTSLVPVADRLNYWRDLFVCCDISRPETSGGGDFRGELLCCRDRDGVAFFHIRCDPIVCSFGRRKSGLVLVGNVRSGSFNVCHDGRTTDLDSNSGLILFDCDRRLVVSSTRCELALVALPRPLVVSLLGRSSTLLDRAVVELPKNGLTPILLAQFETMSRYCAGLDATEAAAAMHATTSLAVAALSSIARSVHQENELGEYFFAAARRYIEAHASHHELTAAKIAAAIGCSRAHLYRLFADRSTHVGALLRDVRLTRAHTLIETHISRPVGLIAFDCGYSDLSAFGKAFKRRYGVSPGEYRREVVPDCSGKGHSGDRPL